MPLSLMSGASIKALTSTRTHLINITQHGSACFCILLSVTSQLSRHAAYFSAPASADDKESDSPKRHSPLPRSGLAISPRCTAAAVAVPTAIEVGRC